MESITKNRQYYKFCLYGFLKNLRFFEAFFILFLIEKGFSFSQIGILYASREIFINIFEIPSGIIADTYGRKNVLVLSFLAYIFSFILFYYSNSFLFFLIAFLMFGIGDAFRSGTHKAMIMQYLKINNWEDQKTNYYGYTRSWSQKGSAIASLIAGFIVFYSGQYQNIFLYSIIPYIINFFLILSYPKALNISSKSQRNTNIPSVFKNFVCSIKEPKVFQLINSSATHSAFLKAIKDYIQPLLLNISLLIPFMLEIEPDKKNGIIIGLVYFLIYLLTSVASKKAAKIESLSPSISAISLTLGLGFGVLCGVFYIQQLWFLAILSFVGIYIIENIRKPILTAFIANKVPNEILSSVISAQSQLKTLLTVIIAISFGVLADTFGIGLAFIIVSVTILTAIIFINLLIKKAS